MFSVGATGTLIFGLASKDIASQVMNGLTLFLSEKMYEVRNYIQVPKPQHCTFICLKAVIIFVPMCHQSFQGDEVRFSDGTGGIIVKMGWLETMIRNSDELVVGIPNTEVNIKYCLLHETVFNLLHFS